ncbi:tyrosine-type recombinase/integrase [Kribbella sp. NPDC026596]|uniref:tyrosine-type recombinase/integrase n=1 Tax=Kribbella sp. NPDC026596 TaxID=3155122 RepID=UPI0033E1CAFD
MSGVVVVGAGPNGLVGANLLVDTCHWDSILTSGSQRRWQRTGSPRIKAISPRPANTGSASRGSSRSRPGGYPKSWPGRTRRSTASSRHTPERFRLIPIIGSAAGLRQGEMFGLSVDDFDFEEQVIRVRRQVKRLGKEYVFALPKNDTERFVPMSAFLAKMAKEHIERFGTTTISLPWSASTARSRTTP